MLFGFHNKKRPKRIFDVEKQDQELQDKLISQGEKRVDELYEIDRKLQAIQKSTRTSLPLFSPAHNYFRTKYKWYYNWHTKPYANSIHYGGLSIMMVVLMASLFLSLINHKSPSTQAAAPAPTTIATVNTAYATIDATKRKTFYDPFNEKHWNFYYNGSSIEYAYSSDSVIWTSAGTITTNENDFSIRLAKINPSNFFFIMLNPFISFFLIT